MTASNEGTTLKAAQNYLDDITNVMRMNQEFLLKNAGETYDEVFELINDAIESMIIGIDQEEFVKRAMCFCGVNVLRPFSYALHLDLLTGNIPVCYAELRLMLETLAGCYLADLRYPNLSFFQERLDTLQQEKDGWRISKKMRELGQVLGVGDDFYTLYEEISQKWIHPKGIADRVVTQVMEKSDVPLWALAIPMNYVESDLDTLIELREHISRFRTLIVCAMREYRRLSGLS